MGESSDTPLKLQFDRRVRLDFRGAIITSNAGHHLTGRDPLPTVTTLESRMR